MRGSSRVETLQSPSTSPVCRDGSTEIIDKNTNQHQVVRFPRSDIDASIRFSFWRCFVSIIGFALVLTDIPRTGLSLSLADSYNTVVPDVYMSNGPFAYPSIQINRTAFNGTYRGIRRGLSVAAANVWAYKFDTLSISQRAIAEHLQLASYPDCIRYCSACPGTTLDLSTTFTMIDDWIGTMQKRYFQPNDRDGELPFVYMTRSNWLDRLHHVLLKGAWRRQDTRLHTVRFHSAEAINSTTHPWTLCGPPAFPHNRRLRRAYVCDLFVRWRFNHPFPPLPAPAPPPRVTLPRHIELRLAGLKRQYPQLQYDLTMLTTRSILSSEPYFAKIPMVFYSSETTEVTTWIRGRNCSSEGAHCETVLVDDYRYEGSILLSNAEDWRFVTGCIRALAQVYIWVRFVTLCGGAYQARCTEPKFRSRSVVVRIFATFVTLSKIPSHVVVYGSWLPVICYSVAHILDSGITHLTSNSVWSSVDGLFQFQLVSYVRSASIQMRNVWMLALVWKIVLFAHTYVNGDSRGAAWVARNGVVAMRGISISFISWLTIFSFLRALRFRDTQVIAFTELPRHTPFNALRYPLNYTNIADFGYRLDVKTAVAATLLVVAYGLLVQLLISRCTKRKTRYFFCRTYYIPHSAGRLWPRAMLYLFWNLDLNKSKQRMGQPRSTGSQRRGSHVDWRYLSSQIMEKTVLPPMPNPHVSCSVCNRAQSLIHWKSVQGCVRHDSLFRIDTRPPEVWAMVRLVNIALLSDPIALARIYVFGQTLFVYARRPGVNVGGTSTTDAWGPHAPESFRVAFLLPSSLEDLGEASTATAVHLELIACIDSKAVAWGALVNCG